MTDNDAAPLDPCLVELNRLAANAEAANETLYEDPGIQDGSSANALSTSDRDPSAAIARWIKLFNYEPHEAKVLVEAHRANVDRERISRDHWNLIRLTFEPAGYDKEAYEHLLELETLMMAESGSIPANIVDVDAEEEGGATQIFALRMGGLLTVDKVREVTGIEKGPKVIDTVGERGFVQLCIVSLEQRDMVVQWLRLLKTGIGL